MSVRTRWRDSGPMGPDLRGTPRRRVGGITPRDNAVLHVVGVALILVSTGMVVSAAVGVVDGGPDVWRDAGSLVAVAAAGSLIGGVAWVWTRVPDRQSPAISFAAVAWSWLAASVLGAFPFVLSGTIAWSRFDDALFESISGFSCTGSTILTDIEGVPHGVLFFRSLSQWLGGMGLIVLAVAILPALKVGGLEMIAAEAPGTTPDRLAPRVRQTAIRLWSLYAAVTAIIAVALIALGGMSPFDGVAHAFTTAATGGFSTRGASIGYFDSALVEGLLVAGMMYCGANFALHWKAVQGDWGIYRRISEFRLYLSMFVGLVALVMWINRSQLPGLSTNLRESVFNVTTLLTSTGFGTSDFTRWGPAAQVVLLLVMLPGGMTGSTAGGMKILRVQVLLKHAAREVRRARHPRAVTPVTLGDSAVPEEIVGRVLAFVFLYLGALLLGGILVVISGADPVTGISSAAATIGNMGPGLGRVGPASTFLEVPRLGRVVLMWLMLFGRLEIFPTLLMFAASFRWWSRWRASAPGVG
ncbi:MAG TPA: TrkH family potassium uptake protein [Acidimicrobiales bacterium]|nr:TrkH family potassium uptake protein [Acidimicrobiales bacterium]